MKKLALLSAGFIAMAVAAQAAPAWVIGEGAVAASDSPTATFGSFSELPAPSATDMANGATAFLIDGSFSQQHGQGDGSLTPAPFIDGSDALNYPANLPNDVPESAAVGTPCLSMGVDLGGSVDVGSVIVYAYNWNNGNGPDVRGVAPFSVYTTTDATPSATGAWTLLLDYTSPAILGGNDWYDAEPDDTTPTIAAGFWDPYLATFNGSAMACADDTGAALAAGVTGIRVDVYRAGFAAEQRHPDNSGAGVQPIQSPFIAEIDVLNLTDTAAYYTPSAVNDWMMF